MNTEDIKVGERYNVYGCIGYKNEDEISITFECKPGVYCPIPFAKSHASMYFSPAPTPPKYDPTRPYKKGDKVRYEPKLGRYEPHITNGSICTVLSDERNGRVQIEYCDDESVYSATIPFFFLELVTPVEELEPYYIVENDIEFQVRMRYEDKDCLISVFRFKNIVEGYKQYYDMLPTMKQAREAAESECKRHSDEYRKEQNNDRS